MILVTGATGNVGRTLTRLLAEAGQEVLAVSRSASPVPLPDRVIHRRADLSVPESVPVERADAVFLIVTGDITGMAARLTPGQRVVLLSSQAAGTRPSHAAFLQAEAALDQFGLSATVLRPGGFTSNTFAWLPSLRAGQGVAAPFADIGLPLIDPDDIAAVAARALLDPELAGRRFELTGPEAITPRERARVVEDVLGQEIPFTEQTTAQARAEMLRFMPEAVVEGTLAILGTPTDAELAIGPHTEELLGRPPHTFRDWAERYADVFRAAAGSARSRIQA